MCRNYKEYEIMIKANKQFETNKTKLLDKLKHDTEKEALLADEIISQLFELAIEIEVSKEIVEKAKLRFELGNPPGKNGSYGDSINWESLLFETDRYVDLFFVSEDGDFYSKLNNEHFNRFLNKEWEEIKESKIITYKRISHFFKEHYPNIELTNETEKEILINNLFEAYSYDNAQDVSKKLLNYDTFSVKQINDIVRAFCVNNQIYWISKNWQIKKVVKEILKPNQSEIEEEILEKLKEIYP